MDDLISRAAAIDALGDRPYNWTDSEAEIAEVCAWESHKSAIENITAVDAVPVVRCDDCWKRGLDNCPMEFYWDSHPADDVCYCAMGERREEQ